MALQNPKIAGLKVEELIDSRFVRRLDEDGLGRRRHGEGPNALIRLGQILLRQHKNAEAETVLREIAASDPEQAVRYAAEVLLLDHAETRAPASPGEGGPR
jgi:hypothetical protein